MTDGQFTILALEVPICTIALVLGMKNAAFEINKYIALLVVAIRNK